MALGDRQTINAGSHRVTKAFNGSKDAADKNTVWKIRIGNEKTSLGAEDPQTRKRKAASAKAFHVTAGPITKDQTETTDLFLSKEHEYNPRMKFDLYDGEGKAAATGLLISEQPNRNFRKELLNYINTLIKLGKKRVSTETGLETKEFSLQALGESIKNLTTSRSSNATFTLDERSSTRLERSYNITRTTMKDLAYSTARALNALHKRYGEPNIIPRVEKLVHENGDSWIAFSLNLPNIAPQINIRLSSTPKGLTLNIYAY